MTYNWVKHITMFLPYINVLDISPIMNDIYCYEHYSL